MLEIQILPYYQEEKLLVCRDVTQLRVLESSKKNFVANVSHEMKTPLTILAGYIETMIEIPTDKKIKDKMLIEMFV